MPFSNGSDDGGQDRSKLFEQLWAREVGLWRGHAKLAAPVAPRNGGGIRRCPASPLDIVDICLGIAWLCGVKPVPEVGRVPELHRVERNLHWRARLFRCVQKVDDALHGLRCRARVWREKAIQHLPLVSEAHADAAREILCRVVLVQALHGISEGPSRKGLRALLLPREIDRWRCRRCRRLNEKDMARLSPRAALQRDVEVFLLNKLLNFGFNFLVIFVIQFI